jgi:hypothetical protein
MAIQQHPLPQDISSYRFRLIGDMTLKQFASLGICILLAIISYSFPLPFFFKYPIVFMFLLLGVGMAFIPVQGRSMDIWLIAFIKSIYSPTQYSWKRTPDTSNASETSIPTKENNQALAQPVSNPSIQITQTPTPISQPPQAVAASTPDTLQPQESPSPLEKQTPPLPQKPSPTPPANTPSSPAINQPPVPSTTAPTTNLPIPFTPTTPNTLVGLTLTPTGNILDGVLVEIKKDSLTLRATKSNKLGQFMFARPLDPGLYQILAEKETFSFAPYSLELTGDIVKPLKIQAQ